MQSGSNGRRAGDQVVDGRFLDEVQDEEYAKSSLYGDRAVEWEALLPTYSVIANATTSVGDEVESRRLSLSGEWLMKESDPRSSVERHPGWSPQVRESPGAVEGWYKPGYNRDGWHRVHVPTTVQSALVQLGELPDPLWDANTYDELVNHGKPESAPWHFRKTRVEQKEWWFARSFDVPAEWEGRSIRLYFDGIDYGASVYLNGQSLGYHAGMFGGPSVDVTRLVHFNGPNELVVRVYPPPESWFNIPKGSPGYGWHYGHLISVGIWRDVELHAVPSVELQSPFVTTTSINGDKAIVAVEYYVRSSNADPVDVEVTGSIEGKTFQSEPVTFSNTLRVTHGNARYRTEVTLDTPRLWWPLGYGDQDLYTLNLTLKEADDRGQVRPHGETVTFGIRTVEMRPVPGLQEEAHYRWQFVINGVPMFIKGANWCWFDPMLQGDGQRYERILELARRGNIQMFRAWGGGIIETDEFYRLCDEKGLMVYQEFPYCWGPADAPLTDLGVLDRQVSRVVKRLRNHPSLIMWGGGNENEPPAGADEALFLVGRRCRQYDPSRPYHRTDPWGGSAHNYQVFHRGEPIDSGYRRIPSVFYGEFGTPSMTNRSSTLKYLPESALETWPPMESSHGVIAHLNQFSLRDIIKQLRYADYGAVRDWETYTEYSQMAQGDALRFAAEIQRSRSNDDKTGFWFYKFTDLFPGHSWAVVDFYGSPKLSYYRAKQVCRPRSAFATYEKLNWTDGEPFVANLHVANDTPERLEDAHVTAALFGSDLAEIWRRRYGVDKLKPNDRQDLDTIQVDLDPAASKPFLLAVTLRSSDDRLISDQWYWFNFQAKTEEVQELEKVGAWDFPEERAQEALAAYAATPESRLLSLPQTELQVITEANGRCGHFVISNRGDVPAFNILIDNVPDGLDDFLEDNSFCLWPRETRRVGFDLETTDGVTVRGWNAPRSGVDGR